MFSSSNFSQTSTMLPSYAIETTSLFFTANFTLDESRLISLMISSTHPCSCLLYEAAGLISAVTETTPAIFPALGCAPLMPPRPAVTKSFPATPLLSIFLHALRTVMVVP